jgi:hypothetical protein
MLARMPPVPSDAPRPEDPLAEILVWATALPWALSPDACDPAHRPARERRNVAALGALLGLEEGTRAHEESGDATQQLLQRLERKLDLVIELVGHSLARQSPPPEPEPIRLSARGFACPAPPTPPQLGARVLLALYPSAHLPLPLELPAEVVPDPDGGLRACFVDDAARLEDELAKLIFREHRRAVARARPGA